jgi:formate-dependent phosphoribosylglycinamide formyltransferase (GAR transformylase)
MTEKERTLAIAGQLGLSIARTVTIGLLNEVRAGLDEIGLPAVVKPVESWISCEQGG